MSSAHSTLRQTEDNGISLAAAAGLVTQSFCRLRGNAKALIALLASITMSDTSDDSDLAKLFRVTARSETVSPQVLALLRKIA